MALTGRAAGSAGQDAELGHPGAPPAGDGRHLRGWRGARVLARQTLAEAWQDRIFGLSAEAGFWQLMSLPPLLLGVLGVIGYFSGHLPPNTINDIERFVVKHAGDFVAPSAVHNDLQPSLDRILHGGRADVVSIGFVLSLWTGSSSMATFVNTITIAYDLREMRSAVRSRLLALWIYLVSVVIGIVMLPLLVLGPHAVTSLFPKHSQQVVNDIATISYWPVVGLGSVLMLATLYHVSVPVRIPWKRAIPGAILAMAVWLGGSLLMRLYLSFAFHANSTYGPLASPIAVLLFFYVTAFAVLLGAELNAEIDKLWPSTETSRARAEHHAEPATSA